ncbi:hypothetical protein D9M69_412670 [compost metagenome]
MLKLHAQEVREQAVVAVVSRPVQRHHEEVGLFEMRQHCRAVLSPGHGITQRCIELLQDAGAQQEAAHQLGLLVEHVFGQELGNRSVGPRKRFEKRFRLLASFQRYRGEPQSRGPALGDVMQPLQQRAAQRKAPALAHEFSRLLGGKAQLLKADLEHLATRPQPPQPKARNDARANHQLPALGHMLYHLPDQVQNSGALDRLEIVQEQCECRGRSGDPFDQLQHAAVVQRGIGSGRHAGYGDVQVGDEPAQVIVSRVDVKPCCSGARCLQSPGVLKHGCCLAKARRCAYDDQAGPSCRVHAFAQPRAVHLGRSKHWRIQLGQKERGPTGQHGSASGYCNAAIAGAVAWRYRRSWKLCQRKTPCHRLLKAMVHQLEAKGRNYAPIHRPAKRTVDLLERMLTRRASCVRRNQDAADCKSSSTPGCSFVRL